MEKQTVFIKRYPSKGELPKESGFYLTNLGSRHYIGNEIARLFDCEPQWWLEEVELPSEDEIIEVAHNVRCVNQFWDGVNFILNKIKWR